MQKEGPQNIGEKFKTSFDVFFNNCYNFKKRRKNE